MDPISTQHCIFVEQKIEYTKKLTIEKNFNIELYSDKIRLMDKELLLEHVFDISYRRATNEIGFLYLHTNQGVIPNLVKTNPTPFIDTFRKVKQFY
ncbi:hypothetical protein [Alkalihalobacterium alkalinitrilicum]|uniref:hypothetical protein n=1 Tax=Alkalihalobacterium alkalinitrilicum TaxID=427920 RepID=UPI0009952A35|nr:hypothetical protein [Alkalihalobacterium alkalinitrilicum]